MRTLCRLVVACGIYGSMGSVAWAGDKDTADEFASRYQDIDEHALAAPKEAEQSIPKLITYFRKQAKTDEQMARAIYRWMADRISYDYDGFFAGKLPDPAADIAFKTRSTICDGYANLFEKLSKQAGLQVGKITGHCKGYGFKYGEKVTRNHAWNVVKIDGVWQFVDVTFGAGPLTAKGEKKQFQNQYFLTPADQFIFDHLPENPNAQMLKKPVSAEQYMKWPVVPPNLFQAGVTASQIHKAIADKDFRDLVVPYRDVSRVRIAQMPLQRHLQAGEPYTFNVRGPKGAKMALVSDGKWHHAESKSNVLEMTFRPQKGELMIMAKFAETDESYFAVLKYVVE